MKANELRIFNLFYPIDRTNNVHLPIESAFKVLTIGFKIEAIPYNKVPAQVEKWSEFDSKDLSPIPLTEEWLMKFGGRPLENGLWIPVYNLKAEFHFEVFKNTDEIVTTLKSQFSDLILDRIKYVHSLQNLFFALTGEELTIK